MTLDTAAHLPALPLAGRAADLAALRSAVERLRAGGGSVLFAWGESGIGKSRLVATLAEECRRAGWHVAEGRAYAVEKGVPFAPFSDALVPVLGDLDEGALNVLSRGLADDLGRLFPGLALRSGGRTPHADELGSRAQLFWSLSRVLEGLAARAPFLLTLDDLQWSDPSSLELLHFLARQLGRAPLAIVATINEDERDADPRLTEVERSLASLGLAESRRIEPLSASAVAELIQDTFRVGAAACAPFARWVRERTGGNPLMIEATLATLVEQGRLRKTGGVWLGWEVADLDPPRSVRAAILHRLERLPPAARETAEVLAVIGTRARHDTVRSVCDLPEPELATALEVLERHGFVLESSTDGWPAYDLRHPLAADVLRGEIAGARRALLHLRVAESLEAAYGSESLQHADELAFHYSRGELGGPTERARGYLAAAGRQALERFADREAVRYLEQALACAGEGAEWGTIVEDLGRARRRTGDFTGAVTLWRRGVAEAVTRGDSLTAAGLTRRIALAQLFAGELGPALDDFDGALAHAREADDPRVLGRVLGARGVCLQGLGRVADAERDLKEALRLARTSGADAILARAHRALLLFHTWSGPPDRARQHGRDALARAEASGDAGLTCTCHWALAVLEGLSGKAEACLRHIEAAERGNAELGSPLMEIALAEVRVEVAFGSGDWVTALAVGERAIALCRTLSQRALLTRLLVWTGLVHLGRGAGEQARAYVEEAARLAGVGTAEGGGAVHALVPAHIGLASLHLANGAVAEAIRVARAALAIVDRTGYRRWAAHRLLPVLAEAYLIARDLEGARETGARLRDEATHLDDPLAAAWADACDALVAWLGGSGAGAEAALRTAAEELEAIPFLPDALRVRRRLAVCLADLGDRAGAVTELRRIHDAFAGLGAERELEKTRRALHEVGARPPTRPASQGAQGLTGREWDVLERVAARKSNKAIARELGISARTVERHLTNIFRKLDTESRVDLADLVRTLPRRRP